jgi:predicted DNA-binding transcriptional regulator AlpA
MSERGVTTEAQATPVKLVYSVGDVAAVLDISVRTAWRMVAAGTLPGPDVKLGTRLLRWRPSTIQQFIDNGGQP